MDKRLLGIALATCGFAAPALSAPVNALAVYTFETGITADDTGNGHDGTLHGGVSTVAGRGGAGSAISLTTGPGTRGIDTGIDINRSVMSSMSMGGWFFALDNGTGPGGKALSQDNGAFGRTLGLDGRGNDAGTDYVAFDGVGGDGAPTDAPVSGGEIGVWVHVAVVYDGASSGLYLNGVLAEAFTDNTTANYGSTGQTSLFIGSNNYYNEDFVGYADDIFVYDRALTAAEIDDIFTNGFGAAVAPVPLPAGGVLLVAALGGLSARRRR